MAEGTIKKLTDKGFGFINTGKDKDLFFHSSSVQGVRFEELREGQKVSFTEGRGQKARVLKTSSWCSYRSKALTKIFGCRIHSAALCFDQQLIHLGSGEGPRRCRLYVPCEPTFSSKAVAVSSVWCLEDRSPSKAPSVQ